MPSSDQVDILLVDDREDGLIALEALLSPVRNYRLVKARSGKEALSLLPDYDFALVLLDVQMPIMDGFETASRIRANPDFRSLPILFVTAINKDDRYVYQGYEAGAIDYIFKPFDPMILTSKVAVFAELFLSKRRLREQEQMLREQEALNFKAKIQDVELQSLRRYRSLADAIPHLVWVVDENGRMIYQNANFESFTGLSSESCEGLGWQRAFHEHDLRRLLDLMKKGEAHLPARFEIEARLLGGDGQFRWHVIRSVGQIDEISASCTWVGTCTDIHERKITQRKLLESQRAAEMASSAKTQFLANMSHEIRTPLNAIIGFTDLMLEPGISREDQLNSLSIVRRNGQQLLKIVDEILDISKVEAGGLEIEKVETNLVSLISGIRSLLQVSAGKKKIQLSFDVDDLIPERILTDSTRLRQILLNLIGNAIKFTHSGQVRLGARVFEHRNGRSELQFEVSDTGVGISPEFSEKIFMPFLQADSSTTRLFGGTGLGLALSRKLARALNGDIWIERTELGRGSTFVASVELEPVAGTTWVKNFSDFPSAENEVAGQVPRTGSLAGRRILLAEDAEENQMLITRFLSRIGAEIVVANNGQEAVDKALGGDFAAILMDIQMPVMDGYEATSRLRQAGYRQPILALTAHALPEEREKSLRTGCNAHLTKPLDRQLLMDALLEHLGVQE